MLEISSAPGGCTFTADETGIVELKAQFVASQPKFLYLRKGEDIGADVIAAFYCLVRDVDWEQLITVTETLYPIAKDLARVAKNLATKLIGPIWRRPKIKDFRIICTKNATTLAAAELNSRLDVKVKFYGPKQSQRHRFYVTDTRYAFFLRDGKKFFGHIGSDQAIIKRLKNMFLDEWESVP